MDFAFCLFLGLKFLVICLILADFGVCGGTGTNSTSKKLKQMNTPNGCPYYWDTGKYGYVYGKPEICDTLLPENLTVEAKQLQLNKSDVIDLQFVPEIEDGASVYYTVTIDPLRKVRNATGVILKVHKLNANGKLGSPIGHLDIKNGPAIKGYCCGSSKFITLVHFLENEENTNSSISIRWYPMNFKQGFVRFKGHVVLGDSYWKIRSETFKIPMILATTTESGEE